MQGHARKSATCGSPYLVARKRALPAEHRYLFAQLILFQLLSNIRLYPFGVFSCRVNIVASAPKLPIPEPVFQFLDRIVQFQAALSLQVPHKTRYRKFRRYGDKHVNMVGANFRFQNFYTLPLTKLSKYSSHNFPFLGIEDFPPELRCEHNMALAVPGGVCG